MKRFAPLITCCYLCSLFLPLSLRANVLPVSESTVTGAAADDYYKSSRAQLKVLSNDKIGQTLIASEALSSTAALSGLVSGAAGLAGVAYYERTGKDPVYAAFSAVASAADAIFVPAYQAFRASFVSPESYPASAAQYVGVEGSVGATIKGLYDYVKNHQSDTPNLYTLFDAHSTTNPSTVESPDSVTLGSIIETSDGTRQITTTWSLKASGSYASQALSIIATHSGSSTIFHIAASSDGIIDFYYSNTYIFKVTKYYYGTNYLCSVHRASSVPATDPATIPIIPGDTIINYDALKDALSSPDPSLSPEITEAVKSLPNDQKITSSNPAPETAPAANPYPVTNNQVQNFFAQNTTNIYNQALETITNNETSTTTEISNDLAKAAAEAAKAQEEEAEKETEETFSPISDSAFTEPYNPGEFDIPARFTTFLNNVKSSGLFSFSNDFFNALPGGGSSVYEIEAGRYGHHTIDLSATLSTGLAILKTILLACFGFLSIRAVIMKR